MEESKRDQSTGRELSDTGMLGKGSRLESQPGSASAYLGHLTCHLALLIAQLPSWTPPCLPLFSPMQDKPQPADDDIVMVDVDDLASDDSFGSDFDALTEADDLPEDPEPTKPPSYSLLDESPKPTPVEAPLPSKIVTERTSRPVQPEVPPPRYPRPGSMCIVRVPVSR